MKSKTGLALAGLTASCVLWAAEHSPERKPLIDINTASAEELEELPGIGPARSAILVEMRERNGPFRCVEELLATPRLSAAQFIRIEPLVTVGEAAKQADCDSLDRAPRPAEEAKP